MSISFAATVKQFIEQPSNIKHQESLSNMLSQLVDVACNEVYREKHEAAEKDFTTYTDPNTIEIGTDDYAPRIMFYIYELIGANISINNTQRLAIDEAVAEICSQLTKKISDLAIKGEQDQTINNLFFGWARFGGAMLQLEEIRPLLKAHKKLDNELTAFEDHNKKINDNKARQIAKDFSESLRQSSRTYLSDVYYRYKDPGQAKTILNKTNLYQRNVSCAIAEALPTLSKHRKSANLRLMGKVLLTIASICTLGIALIPKLIYSKVTTGSTTIFDDITKSEGAINQISTISDDLINTVPTFISEQLYPKN